MQITVKVFNNTGGEYTFSSTGEQGLKININNLPDPINMSASITFSNFSVSNIKHVEAFVTCYVNGQVAVNILGDITRDKEYGSGYTIYHVDGTTVDMRGRTIEKSFQIPKSILTKVDNHIVIIGKEMDKTNGNFNPVSNGASLWFYISEGTVTDIKATEVVINNITNGTSALWRGALVSNTLRVNQDDAINIQVKVKNSGDRTGSADIHIGIVRSNELAQLVEGNVTFRPNEEKVFNTQLTITKEAYKRFVTDTTTRFGIHIWQYTSPAGFRLVDIYPKEIVPPTYYDPKILEIRINNNIVTGDSVSLPSYPANKVSLTIKGGTTEGIFNKLAFLRILKNGQVSESFGPLSTEGFGTSRLISVNEDDIITVEVGRYDDKVVTDSRSIRFLSQLLPPPPEPPSQPPEEVIDLSLLLLTLGVLSIVGLVYYIVNNTET